MSSSSSSSSSSWTFLGATRPGGIDSLSLQSFPLPQESPIQQQQNPEDVWIQVAYSDVNPVDLQKLGQSHKTSGNGSAPYNNYFVPGFGGSGTVLEVGSKVPSSLKPGTRVCFFLGPSTATGPMRGCGSYSSHVVVDHRCVAPCEEQVDLRQAASIPVAGLTALESLTKVGLGPPSQSIRTSTSTKKKTRASSLLIVGGAGGVGSWAILLARAWYPQLQILVTASTPEQADWCRSLGATQVMKHDEIQTVLSGGPKGSVNAILCLTEPTKDLFAACAEVLTPYGHVCLVVAGPSIKSIDLSFLFFKSAHVSMETVFSSIRTNYSQIMPCQELSVILDLLATQQIKQAPLSPDLETSLTTTTLAEATQPGSVLYALQEQPHGRRGKFVLAIQGTPKILFLDLKTASILSRSKKDCLDRQILHPTTTASTKDLPTKGDFSPWKEGVVGTEREECIQKITSHKTLGVVKVAGKQWTDYEDGLEMQEAENVKKKWGVTLKKRSKNVKGEELLFLDPLTGILGEVSRKTCLGSGFFQVETTADGKEVLANSVSDYEERDAVIHTIRKVLKLNLE